MVMISFHDNVKETSKSGNAHIVILLILTLSIIGCLGFVFYRNITTNKIDSKNTVTTIENTESLDPEIDKAFDENLVVDPSGSIFKTYTYEKPYTTESIVLYSNGTAVYSIESTIGDAIISGVYKTIDQITYVKFTKHIEHGVESTDNSILILNPDGTASSKIFDTTKAFIESGGGSNSPANLIYFEGQLLNSPNTSNRITVIAENIDNGSKFIGDSVVSECYYGKCIFESFHLKVTEGRYYIYTIPTDTNFDSSEKTYFNQCTKNTYVDKGSSETECNSSKKVIVNVTESNITPEVVIDLKDNI